MPNKYYYFSSDNSKYLITDFLSSSGLKVNSHLEKIVDGERGLISNNRYKFTYRRFKDADEFNNLKLSYKHGRISDKDILKKKEDYIIGGFIIFVDDKMNLLHSGYIKEIVPVNEKDLIKEDKSKK